MINEGSDPIEKTPAWFVVFGAAVRPDGSASGTLRRRVEGAVRAAEACRSAMFLVTGAVGKYGPAEADVMRDILLKHSVEPDRIICEREGHDTLSSVINTAHIIETKAHSAEKVVVCSSAYHNPRCVWLFRLAGINSTWAPMPSDRPHLPWSKLIFFYAKEPPAIIWDTLMILIKNWLKPNR